MSQTDLIDAVFYVEKIARKLMIKSFDERDAAEARAHRIEVERDRYAYQVEKAAIILFATQYTANDDKIFAAIEAALSALGYDADNEGELTTAVEAYVANNFR